MRPNIAERVIVAKVGRQPLDMLASPGRRSKKPSTASDEAAISSTMPAAQPVSQVNNRITGLPPR